jgi:hypothetical protein
MGTSVRITPRPSGAVEREYNYNYLINQVKRRRNLVNYFNSEPKSVRYQVSVADIMRTSIRSGSDNSEPGNRAGDATVPWRAIADARNEDVPKRVSERLAA